LQFLQWIFASLQQNALQFLQAIAEQLHANFQLLRSPEPTGMQTLEICMQQFTALGAQTICK